MTNGAGSAYIFTLNTASGVYDQTQKLLASDGQADDYFGVSVSMSTDGKVALIAAEVRFVVIVLIVLANHTLVL